MTVVEEAEKDSLIPPPRRRKRSFRPRYPAWLTVPSFVYYAIFFLGPMAILVAFSLATQRGFGSLSYGFDISQYRLIGSSLYVNIFVRTLVMASLGSLLTIAVGYPLAYWMARYLTTYKLLALLLLIVPFWTSFLIRIYAWINILQHDGLLNRMLLALHLVSQPLVWLSTDTAMYLGIVYSYLPFMILPLYATLAKLEPGLEEAASDLGASPREVFWLVTFPLSLPGVGAGVLLCFIPIVGEFVIPDLLAGSNSLMIGQTLWLEFFTNKDWPVASACAIALLLLLLAPLLLYDRLQRRQLEAR
jgi:putrescine transport system permease protein